MFGRDRTMLMLNKNFYFIATFKCFGRDRTMLMLNVVPDTSAADFPLDETVQC